MARKKKWIPFDEAKAFARPLGLKSRREYFRWAKTDGKPDNIPANPCAVYADEDWISWPDFLGVAPNVEYWLYDKAQKYVSKLGLKGRNDWNKFSKSEDRPQYIPVAPWRTYKNKGWESLGKFLGTDRIANQKREFRPFKEAREFARKLGFKNRGEWRLYANSGDKPDDIPSNPAVTYVGKGWISWPDFLGNDNVSTKQKCLEFCSFEEAHDFIRAKGFKTKEEFFKWAKSDDRPEYIPYDPQKTYKVKGWKNWGDFLGTGRIANQKRKFRSFREARAYVRSKGFKNQKEWKEFVDSDNRPEDIPKYPNETYAEKGWISMDDWLGADNAGWTVEKIRKFVASLLPYIEIMSEADLYIISKQSGLLDIASCAKGNSFVQAFKTGKFPKEELEKFVNVEPSLVDDFLSDGKTLLESREDLLDDSNCIYESDINVDQKDFPTVETKEVLAFLESQLFANFDDEAVDFLIKNAVHRIWKHAFKDETLAVKQIEQSDSKGLYVQEVKKLFLQDYEEVRNFVVPDGYIFPFKPNLMQLYTSHLVKKYKRIGNWSGTGAGKTLSAILASRVIDAKITVICCPNNVIDNWKESIEKTYSDSLIQVKNFKIEDNKYDNIYIILNYEFFQQPQSERKLKIFLKKHQVDFVIIDEIHFSKQREKKKMSTRKKIVASFLSEAAYLNHNLHVLGMSATPVINNLFEGKILIELITGVCHDDLKTKATVSNCMAIYAKLVTNGIRFVPDYDQRLNKIVEEIDCSDFLPEIRSHKSLIALEVILTKAKVPFILEQLRPKTIIYTHYREGIETILQDEIEKHGWRVAMFNGDSKEGLKRFVEGDTDILIASSCIGTGIDGLQHCCSRLIFNCLPWTHAEYKQIIGRIYRQGMVSDNVDIIIPLTFADINGQRWSWCESRWKRIAFKKSISDAAVDGVCPEGHLYSKIQAHKDMMQWLKRLEKGEINENKRSKIIIPLEDVFRKKPLRRTANFSRMNQRINKVLSSETHKRFINNPQEWLDYHEEYRATRKDWSVVPCQEAIKWCKERPNIIIGDFGCGEAYLARELENKVYSFDHIAINDDVIACDMVNVPLEDKILDVAIFSLSLMGSNYIDYLIEAYRCLKLDGYLWIAEPTSRIKDVKLVRELLFCIGFGMVEITDKSKFTFVKAIKSESDRKINEEKLRTLKSENIIV